VLTSTSLLVGAALVQIPEGAPEAVTWLRGLFLAKLAMQMCKPAGRLSPEALEYCCRLLMQMVDSNVPPRSTLFIYIQLIYEPISYF
jgi:hypothetical protein